MGAINFDQPSAGTVNSPSNILSLKNNGTGGGLECIVNSATGSGIGVVNQTGHGIWTESKGSYAGLVAKSAKGAAIQAVSETGETFHGEANSTTSAGIGVVNQTGFGIWAESKGDLAGIVGKSKSGHGIWGESFGAAVGLVGKSATGNGVHAESLGGGNGLYATSATGVGVRAKGVNLAAYFEGNVEITGDIRLVNADCAEEFEVSNDIEPGTVMVLNGQCTLEPSSISYDKKVAGIISGAGGFKPGIVLDKQNQQQPRTSRRAAVALIGKVYCKVDATVSPIEVGDLLTTSSTIGHAMKADCPISAFGSVIGKALQPLKNSKGIIPVLVALQ
jgi:hypothetical protein